MINFGAVPVGSVLPIFFTTYGASTGQSITLTGLAVTDIEVYKGASITQRASDNGYTLIDTDGIDVDSVTGLHGFSIDLGDNSDASFYVAGSFYTVVVSAVTIDSQAVTFLAATFRIVAAESIAGTPKADVAAWLGTAAATPTVNGVPEVDITHIGGTAVTAAAGIPEVKVASIAANAITAAATAADFSTEVNTAVLAVLGALNDAAADGAVTTTDTMVAYLKQVINTLEGTPGIPAFPSAASAANGVSMAEVLRAVAERLGVPSDLGGGASVAANLADIEGQTDDIGAAGAGLTAADDAVIAAIAGLDAKLDTIDNFLDTEIADIKTKTDQLTFTKANELDANVQSLNGTTLNGDGSGTPWGP